jgi:hypothetical protein
MVVLILLGIAFFTFSTMRAEREQSASPRLRSEDSVQQEGPTPGGQKTLLKKFQDLRLRAKNSILRA